jgi:hypothetical protein
MPTSAKQSSDPIRIKQYVVDEKGRQVAVIIDMKELSRLNRLLGLIPPAEAWLYEDAEAMASVEKGLQDATKGNTSILNPKSTTDPTGARLQSSP